MADLLDVDITGTGTLGSIESASVNGSSITVHSPTDSTPSIATVSVTGKTTETSHFLSNNDVTVVDMNGLGQIGAVVDTVSVDNASTTISGPSGLSRFLTGNINIPAVASGTPATAMDLAMQLTGEQRASNTYSGGDSENTAIYTMLGHGAGFGPGGTLLSFPDTTNWSPFTRAGVTFRYPQSTSYSPPSFGAGFTSALTGKIYADNPLSNITMKMPIDDPTEAGILNFIFPKDATDSPEFGLPTGRATLGYREGDLSAAYLGFDFELSNNRFKLFYESVANPGETTSTYISTSSLTGDEWIVSIRFYSNATGAMDIDFYVSDTDGSHSTSGSISMQTAPDVAILLWANLPTMRMVRTDSIPEAWAGWNTPYEIATAANILVSNSLTSTPISGMNGTVWDYLNQVCSANTVEVAMVSGVVTLRGRGALELDVSEFIQAPKISPVSNKAEKVSLEWSEAINNPPVDAGQGGLNLFTNPSFEASSGTTVIQTNLHTTPNPGQNATGYEVFTSGGGQTFGVSSSSTGGLNGLGYWRLTGSGANTGAAGITLGSALNVTLGQVITVGGWVRVSASSVVVEMAMGTYTSAGGGGTRVTASGNDFNSVANEWVFVHFTYTVTSGIASIRPYVRLRAAGAVQSGRTFDFDQMSLSIGSNPADFTGDTATTDQYTYDWTGTAYATTSTQSGFTVSGVTTNNCNAVQSTDWNASGLFSMRLIPTNTNNTSYVVLGASNLISSVLTPGKTYTILATARLSAAQTGSLNTNARSILYVSSVGGNTGSTQAANTSGVTSISLTFTVNAAETSASLRLYNGATFGNGDVWWDNVLLIEGTYTGAYFDGSTPATDSARYYWTGTTDASTSVWIKRIPDVYGVYEVPGTYQVDSGATQEVLLDTPNYYSGLIQPEPKEVSSMIPPSTASGYSVSGSDNLPLDPVEWLDYGGSLKVETTDIYGQIKMTLTGPTEEIPGVPGPYSFSASDGETSYPLIRIPYIGTRFAEPITTTTATGAAPSPTTQIEPVTFTNVCATSWGKVWSLLSRGAKNFAGPRTTVTFTIPTIHALGFGLVEGSLFRVRNSTYRVMNVTFNIGSTSITALPYNTFGTFENSWTGKTYAEFASLWDDDDYTYEDFSVSPLTTNW